MPLTTQRSDGHVRLQVRPSEFHFKSIRISQTTFLNPLSSHLRRERHPGDDAADVSVVPSFVRMPRRQRRLWLQDELVALRRRIRSLLLRRCRNFL